MLLQSSMLATLGDGCPSVQSRYFLVQESIRGDVIGKSRYAGGSFAFGDGSFPEVTVFWRRALTRCTLSYARAPSSHERGSSIELIPESGGSRQSLE